jgi:glycosyltransferase involved in cell wall biosynthesis
VTAFYLLPKTWRTTSMKSISSEMGQIYAPSASPRSKPGPLAVIGTHPVQYHAPVYRAVAERFGVPVHAIYGSDFSIKGGFDRLFQQSITWDNFTLDPITTTFLSTVEDWTPQSDSEITAAGLDGVLKKLAPAAVLLTGYYPKFHLSAFLTVRWRGIPILFRAETTDHTWEGSPIKAWLRDGLLRMLYRNCHCLLPVGTHSYEHYKRLGCPESKLLFAPYCVDTSAFAADEEARSSLREPKRRELGVRDDDILLMFSGKLARHKGPQLLIEAVRSMAPADRDRMLVVFVGSGPEQNRLRELASAAEHVRTCFAGFQNQTQLSPYYHAADLLVMPSTPYPPYKETWGLVVNEALHHGVPCVVSDAVGCAVDLIEPGKTGEVTGTGDAASLAAGIRRALPLVGDPNIRFACRDRVSRFTIDHAAAGIARAYWSVIGG